MPFLHRVDRSLLATEPRGELARLGSAHDGGYVVALEAIRAANHLLSFGVATNWDFERDALRINPRLTLDAYDPSVGRRRFAEMAVRSALSAPLRLVAADARGARSSFRRARTALDYFRFFSGRATHTGKRVWYNSDRDSVAIADVLTSARTNRHMPMFAKIDIEGSEYRILPWIIGAADLFTGLVIEFHHTDICAELFNAQLEQLRARFVVAHVHGNNYGDVAVDGSLPLIIEITLLHRCLAAGLPDRHIGRGPVSAPLDAPNDPARPDYVIDLGVPHHARRPFAFRGSSV